MPDVFSKAKRSQIMSKISGKENALEIRVRKYLFSKGFRYRKNSTKLFGKPDIVLPKYKTVILIHGCFWHHHRNCKYAKLPATSVEFWEKKIQRNVARDNLVRKTLKSQGWKVHTIWQCKLRTKVSFEETMSTLVDSIRSMG